MKILIVGPGKLASQYGGGEVYVRNLIAGLLNRKYEIVYLSIVLGKDGEHLLNRVEHDALVEYQFILPSNSTRSGNQVAIVKLVADLFCEIQPDVIHAHAWKQTVCLASKKAGVPSIVTAHHGGIVCPAGALLNADDQICKIPASEEDCLRCCVRAIPGHTFWFPILSLMPLSVRIGFGKWIRKLPFIPFVTPLGQVSWLIRNKLQEVQDIGQFADWVIAPSPAIKEALIRNGIPDAKIKTVAHGIPMPDIQGTVPHKAHQPLRLIYVGRINYVKGLHILLEASQGLAPIKYEVNVVGSAVTRQEQRYLAGLKTKYSTVNVNWLGQKTHDEIFRMLRGSDVMVHPAIFLEVFGLTIAESLAVGCPVVATRCGGPEIQIRDEINGLLVPPNDVDALRATLLRLVDSPALIQKMSSQSGSVRSIEEHVLDIEKVYGSCMDKPSMAAGS